MTSPARILIIDDDPIIRMLASSALSDVGHTVTEAESAEAAIDVLAESRPDLLVLDLVMPVSRLTLSSSSPSQPMQPA